MPLAGRRRGGCEPRLLEQAPQLGLHPLQSIARVGPVDDVRLFKGIGLEIVEFIHPAELAVLDVLVPVGPRGHVAHVPNPRKHGVGVSTR